MTRREHRLASSIALGLALSIPMPGLARADEAKGKSQDSKSQDSKTQDSKTQDSKTQDSKDEEAARSLFRDARKLASDGRFEEACPKFEESLKLDPGIGTRFNLADCWEHTGRLKQAQDAFLEVADSAHDKGQTDREEVARTRAHALDEKIPRLGIEAKEMIQGLDVLLDGKSVDRTRWASGERLDPGPHDIEAKAPNKKSWSLHVEFAASADKVTIMVPKLDDEAPKEAASPDAKAGAAEPAKEAPAEPVSKDKPPAANQTLKVLLLSGAGAGVLLAGTGFAIYKLSNDNAKGVCPSSTGCSADDVQRHSGYVDDAATGRAIGYLGLGLTSAALIGLGVVTITTSSRGDSAHGAAVSAAPLVGGAWGASVRGRF